MRKDELELFCAQDQFPLHQTKKTQLNFRHDFDDDNNDDDDDDDDDNDDDGDDDDRIISFGLRLNVSFPNFFLFGKFCHFEAG